MDPAGGPPAAGVGELVRLRRLELPRGAGGVHGPGAEGGWRVRALPAELFLLSADTPAALADRARALAKEAEVPRSCASWRGSRCSRSAAEAGAARGCARRTRRISGRSSIRSRRTSRRGRSRRSRRRSCTARAGRRRGGWRSCSRGRSQYVGMGADALVTFDPARAAWDAVAGVAIADAPLHEVVFPRPVFSDEDRAAQEARLRETRWAQPAIGATSLCAPRAARGARGAGRGVRGPQLRRDHGAARGQGAVRGGPPARGAAARRADGRRVVGAGRDDRGPAGDRRGAGARPRRRGDREPQRPEAGGAVGLGRGDRWLPRSG